MYPRRPHFGDWATPPGAPRPCPPEPLSRVWITPVSGCRGRDRAPRPACSSGTGVHARRPDPAQGQPVNSRASGATRSSGRVSAALPAWGRRREWSGGQSGRVPRRDRGSEGARPVPARRSIPSRPLRGLRTSRPTRQAFLPRCTACPYYPLTPLTEARLPSSSIRRTKIVATLGPAWSHPARMAQLLDAGVNVVRVNASHGTPQLRAQWIRDLQEVRKGRQRLGGDPGGPARPPDPGGRPGGAPGAHGGRRRSSSPPRRGPPRVSCRRPTPRSRRT